MNSYGVTRTRTAIAYNNFLSGHAAPFLRIEDTWKNAGLNVKSVINLERLDLVDTL